MLYLCSVKEQSAVLRWDQLSDRGIIVVTYQT